MREAGHEPIRHGRRRGGAQLDREIVRMSVARASIGQICRDLGTYYDRVRAVRVAHGLPVVAPRPRVDVTAVRALVAESMTDAEIAERLSISRKTAGNVRRRLGLKPGRIDRRPKRRDMPSVEMPSPSRSSGRNPLLPSAICLRTPVLTARAWRERLADERAETVHQRSVRIQRALAASHGARFARAVMGGVQ